MKQNVKITYSSKNLDEELNRLKKNEEIKNRQHVKIVKSLIIGVLQALILLQCINLYISDKSIAEVKKPIENLIITKVEANEVIKEETIKEETSTIKTNGTQIEHIKNIEEQAFNFIAKFEGYHDKPYWDQKQYSCGYGMRCSKDTTGITKEKSKKFVIERIKSIREKHKLYKYDDNIEIALISFIYNIGHAPVGMDRYIRTNHIEALKNMMRKYVYAGNIRMGGLVKRRNAETNLF